MRKIMKKNNTKEGGFTLIEILIVIGIIAILAAIVLIAVNPARQFAQANNTQRSSNVNAILNAIGQYIVDNKGVIPDAIDTGTSEEIKGNGDSTDDSGEADLCNLLVPTYISAFPTDPQNASTKGAGIAEADCETSDTYDTGYEITRTTDGRITVSAPKTQDVDDVGVTPAISVSR